MWVKGACRLCRVMGLLVLPIMLVACQELFAPLEPLDRSAPGDPTLSEPIILRAAVCWAGMPLMQELEAAYARENPRVSFDLVATSSEVAEDLVLSGQADLAIVIPEEDAGSGLSRAGYWSGVRSRTIAHDALAFVVSASSPLERVTFADLARLYGGEILDWEELGAGSGHVEYVVREPGSRVPALFDNRIMGGAPISSSAVIMPHDRAVLDYIAEHPGALGYLSTAYLSGPVKALSLEGVALTASEVKSGRYPLTYRLAALISVDAPREASRFVAFAVSARGCRLGGQRYSCPR